MLVLMNFNLLEIYFDIYILIIYFDNNIIYVEALC